MMDNQNRMRVHPRFLHSNATSHKWAFGAIAELIDNAVDEACNGATSVFIDSIQSFGNSHALLIQDDGGGMDPDIIRQCMNFGFSNKYSNSSIGQYGNGFKTSTMRLGEDVIVFSRCQRSLTQSVGILSSTFLRETDSADVVVPMVDYNFNLRTRGFERMIRNSEKHFFDNLCAILRWSPFSKEEELLNEFNYIENSGTRIIVFNLWLNDNGDGELDFDADKQDILIRGTFKAIHNCRIAKALNEKHIGNLFHYSLRAYVSILYLRLPENFKIFLRGYLVDPYYIVEDLMYKQCIKYSPQVGRKTEHEEIGTVIGFLNGAPYLDIHGFNIYHRYRLIMPFWHVAHKCKGVVGVLQVDCLKPTHDKQGFGNSGIFFRLETRLKLMAQEYWKYHCHLIGYSVKIPSSSELPDGYQLYNQKTNENVQEASPKRRKCALELEKADVLESLSGLTNPHGNCGESSQAELPENKNYGENVDATEELKQKSVTSGISPARETKSQIQIQHGRRDRKQAFITMVQQRKQLNEKCMELEKSVEELTHKEKMLRTELEIVQQLHNDLYDGCKSVGKMDRC